MASDSTTCDCGRHAGSGAEDQEEEEEHDPVFNAFSRDMRILLIALFSGWVVSMHNGLMSALTYRGNDCDLVASIAADMRRNGWHVSVAASGVVDARKRSVLVDGQCARVRDMTLSIEDWSSTLECGSRVAQIIPSADMLDEDVDPSAPPTR